MAVDSFQSAAWSVRPAPGPGNWRDYYVLAAGKEPADCHMVIRWKAPIRVGMKLPRGAQTYCKGNCDPHVYVGCGPAVINNPIPAVRMLQYCTCILPSPRIRKRYSKIVAEAWEGVEEEEEVKPRRRKATAGRRRSAGAS